MATPQYIRLELFPAIIKYALAEGDVDPIPDRGFVVNGTKVIDRTKVYVTDSEFYVFMDSDTGPAQVYVGGLADAYGKNVTGYTVVIDSGPTFDVKRSTGCGCGSRLRGFIAFPGVPYASTLDSVSA